MIKLAFLLLILLVGALARWDSSHAISGEASDQLSRAIKAELLNNMILITNPTIKKALLADLNEPDDSKRTLTAIDNQTAATIFAIFELKDPHCDTNKDGVVSGNELKCLGKIWKNFVPNG